MNSDKFRRWAATHAPTIASKQEQRRREVEDAVARGLYSAMRNRGLTLLNAGHDLLQRFPYGCGHDSWTPHELKTALSALGWSPKKGGAA